MGANAQSPVSRIKNQKSAVHLMVTLLGVLPDGKTLNLIPEGMVHETGVKCILGNGVVVNPKLLLEDFESLKANNIDYNERLLISQR